MQKTSLLHALAYLGAAIVTGLEWVSHLDPSNLAFLPPKVASPSIALIGLAAAVLAFLHQTGWLQAKPSDKVTTIAKVFVPLLLVLPLLHGCALVSKFDAAATSTTAQPYMEAGALTAVTVAEANGVTAAQITGIAQAALAADSSTAATLATVAAAANALIAKLGLPAGDIQAASILEAALEVALANEIGDNATLAQTQAAVADMLSAIIAAANPTAVPAPSSSPTTYVAPAVVPAQNKHFVLAAVESPPVVGAAASLVLVTSLQAFAHLTTAVPVAAAITVLFTVGAAMIANLVD